MSFTASYPGGCTECPEPIRIGELIESVGLTDYKHIVCPEPRPIAAIERLPGETPCPTCHLIHAGSCF